MTRARAKSMSGVMSDDPKERWLWRMRNPDYTPGRFKPIPKEVGSKKLVNGEWVEVKEDDDDAIPC